MHLHPTEQVIACFTYLRFILSHTLHTTTGPLQERITQALSLCCLLHICSNWGWMNLNNHFLEPQQIPNYESSYICEFKDAHLQTKKYYDHQEKQTCIVVERIPAVTEASQLSLLFQILHHQIILLHHRHLLNKGVGMDTKRLIFSFSRKSTTKTLSN